MGIINFAIPVIRAYTTT